MTLAELGIAYLLTCTLPTVQADPRIPETGLESLYVWAQPRWARLEHLVARKSIRGREGMRDTTQVTLEPGVWSVAVVLSDSAGNISALSNRVGLGLTLAVIDAPSDTSTLFDITGRRVGTNRKQLMPGIYFERRGRRMVKVVVLR